MAAFKARQRKEAFRSGLPEAGLMKNEEVRYGSRGHYQNYHDDCRHFDHVIRPLVSCRKKADGGSCCSVGDRGSDAYSYRYGVPVVGMDSGSEQKAGTVCRLCGSGRYTGLLPVQPAGFTFHDEKS